MRLVRVGFTAQEALALLTALSFDVLEQWEEEYGDNVLMLAHNKIGQALYGRAYLESLGQGILFDYADRHCKHGDWQ